MLESVMNTRRFRSPSWRGTISALRWSTGISGAGAGEPMTGRTVAEVGPKRRRCFSAARGSGATSGTYTRAGRPLAFRCSVGPGCRRRALFYLSYVPTAGRGVARPEAEAGQVLVVA